MPLHLSRTLSWAANSAVFLLAPFVVMTALFLAAFLPLPLDQFFYDASAAVFPIGCPHQIEYSHCVAVTAWYQYWSVFIWGATALLYGGLVTRRSVRYKLVLGVLLIPAVIGLLQAVMLLLGWQWFIDTPISDQQPNLRLKLSARWRRLFRNVQWKPSFWSAAPAGRSLSATR